MIVKLVRLIRSRSHFSLVDLCPFKTENPKVIFLEGIIPPPTSQLEIVMTFLREAQANPQCRCGQKINITIHTNYTDSIHRFVLAVEHVLLS